VANETFDTGAKIITAQARGEQMIGCRRPYAYCSEREREYEVFAPELVVSKAGLQVECAAICATRHLIREGITANCVTMLAIHAAC
jgi:hypothetical protein